MAQGLPAPARWADMDDDDLDEPEPLPGVANENVQMWNAPQVPDGNLQPWDEDWEQLPPPPPVVPMNNMFAVDARGRLLHDVPVDLVDQWRHPVQGRQLPRETRRRPYNSWGCIQIMNKILFSVNRVLTRLRIPKNSGNAFHTGHDMIFAISGVGRGSDQWCNLRVTEQDVVAIREMLTAFGVPNAEITTTYERWTYTSVNSPLVISSEHFQNISRAWQTIVDEISAPRVVNGRVPPNARPRDRGIPLIPMFGPFDPKRFYIEVRDAREPSVHMTRCAMHIWRVTQLIDAASLGYYPLKEGIDMLAAFFNASIVVIRQTLRLPPEMLPIIDRDHAEPDQRLRPRGVVVPPAELVRPGHSLQDVDPETRECILRLPDRELQKDFGNPSPWVVFSYDFLTGVDFSIADCYRTDGREYDTVRWNMGNLQDIMDIPIKDLSRVSAPNAPSPYTRWIQHFNTNYIAIHGKLGALRLPILSRCFVPVWQLAEFFRGILRGLTTTRPDTLIVQVSNPTGHTIVVPVRGNQTIYARCPCMHMADPNRMAQQCGCYINMDGVAAIVMNRWITDSQSLLRKYGLFEETQRELDYVRRAIENRLRSYHDRTRVEAPCVVCNQVFRHDVAAYNRRGHPIPRNVERNGTSLHPADARCPHCQTRQCRDCGAHGDAFDETHLSFMDGVQVFRRCRGRSDIESDAVQHMPCCGNPVVRYQGCATMYCRDCDQYFCWMCLCLRMSEAHGVHRQWAHTCPPGVDYSAMPENPDDALNHFVPG